MSNTCSVSCLCGEVEFTLTGEPKVRGFCHCDDCRELLNVPFHSVTAWDKTQLKITSGQDKITEFQHPTKRMKRFNCSVCGESLFNSNAMDWRVVSQLLLRRQLADGLPPELSSKSHFYYGQRILDVVDELPKKE